MVLFVDGTNRGITCRDISFWVPNHEVAFELLNELVRDEWILERATIVDNLDRISLPVQAFDGQPVRAHIATIEQQWQLILASRSSGKKYNSKASQMGWLKQLDGYYENLILYLQKSVMLIEGRKSRLGNQPPNQYTPRINAQLDRMLAWNKRLNRDTRRAQLMNRRRIHTLTHELTGGRNTGQRDPNN
jgi:hypothetical protein